MTKFQYKRHVETVHGANIGEENSGKFECEDCHKEYKNLDTLRQHKKVKKHMEYSKGQLILKCLFGVIVWTKKPTKFFPGFLP